MSSTSKVEKLNKEIIRKIEPIITLESVSQISNPTLIEESEVILDDVPPLVKDEIDPEMEQVLDHVIEEDIFCSNIMENCENLFLDAEDDHLIELS